MTRGTALWLAVLANALWSGSYVAGKVAQQHVSTIELNFARFLIAALFLAPIVWLQRDKLRLGWRDWLLVTALGLTEVLNKFYQFYGLTLTSASDAALLIVSESIFIALLAWLILRERLTPSTAASLAVGFLGVYIVVEGGLVSPRLSGAFGDLLILLAIFVESFYTIIGKDLLRRHDPMLITALALLINFGVWTPAAAWDVASHGWPVLTPASWAAILYLGIAATVISYSLWFVLLRHVDAAIAAPTLFIQPFLGTVIAALLLRERPSPATLAGGALIMAGVCLGMQARRRPIPPAGAQALAE